MREIKFRLWDAERMEYDPSAWCESINESLAYENDEDAIVMQYTGLKDKNGKEIFEGDVVCYVEDVVVESEGGFNRTEPEGQIGSVEFSNGAYWVNSKEFAFYSYGEANFLWSELEVIGNIYENPELIN